MGSRPRGTLVKLRAHRREPLSRAEVFILVMDANRPMTKLIALRLSTPRAEASQVGEGKMCGPR
jgi:hypothetical protein